MFPYSVFYVYYEQYLTIIPDMLENIGLALCKEFGFTFILYQLYSSCSVCLFLSRSVVIKIIPSLLSLPPSLPTSLSFFPSSLLPPSVFSVFPHDGSQPVGCCDNHHYSDQYHPPHAGINGCSQRQRPCSISGQSCHGELHLTCTYMFTYVAAGTYIITLCEF